LGKSIFGIKPARPLSSLVVQAENDKGDMAEIRDGIINGLELTQVEANAACRNIHVCSESTRTSGSFFDQVIVPLLEKHTFDLLVIDPVLAYLGGEANSQKDVGGFLRNSLNPILQKRGIAAIVVHHTNKPPSGKEKRDWTPEEFADLGAGSAEWANWPRAVVALRSTGMKDSCGGSIFDLCLGKRASRSGWRDPETEAVVFSKAIRHARRMGDICWHEVPPDELASVEEKGAAEDLLEAVRPGETIEKKQLIEMKVRGIGVVRGRRFVEELIATGQFEVQKVKRKGAPPQVFLRRAL
jgi:hypothetical protein